MSLGRLVNRYAKSLLGLAIEQNKVEKIVSDISTFGAMAEERDFELMLKSPIISNSKKKAILDDIFKGQLDPMTDRFFKLAIDRGRSQYLKEMAVALMEQYYALKNMTGVHLTTAHTWSDAEINALKTKLENEDALKRTFDIITDVDESLVGGFTIEFGDQIYDASVKHKLNILKKEINN